MLSTYKQDAQNDNRPIQRQYFYNREEAFESFATRSGLVDERKLFTETQLQLIHAGLVKLRTMDEELSEEDMKTVGELINRVEEIVPELHREERKFDVSRLLDALSMFRVNLYRSVQDNAKGGENSGVKGGENSGVKGGDDFGDKVRIREKAQKLTDTQEKILDCIAEDKYISVKKIAERIDISRRTVENNIKKMKESDIVVRHGSPKNGCWEIVE